MLNKKLYITLFVSSILLSSCAQVDSKENISQTDSKSIVEESGLPVAAEKTETDSVVDTTEPNSGNDNSEDEGAEENRERKETSEFKGNGEQKENSVPQGSVSYKIHAEQYINKDIKINFPQLTNMDDANFEEKVNDLIKTEVLKVLSYYPDMENELTLEIDYEISRNDADLLSVQYNIDGYVEGAAHPNNLFYSTNVNMKNGTKLRSSDLVTIDENFVNQFKENSSALISEQEAILKEISNEELLKLFKEADSLDQIGTENQTDTFSYVTEDSLGSSIPVPHVLGGHAEFEIKLREIEGYIKF